MFKRFGGIPLCFGCSYQMYSRTIFTLFVILHPTLKIQHEFSVKLSFLHFACFQLSLAKSIRHLCNVYHLQRVFPSSSNVGNSSKSSSLGLGLIRISKANSSTILVTSWMKCMTAKDVKALFCLTQAETFKLEN